MTDVHTDVSEQPRLSATPATAPAAPAGQTGAGDPRRASDRRGEHRGGGGRLPIVAVMIVSILLASVTSYWARARRTAGDVAAGSATTGTSLASMNSFALALLLGGLRGPLVMFLWTNSENQKNAKDLEGFDTAVEWIRLLQPEFDSVHIFQVWNKAYNISVQKVSVENKYRTILDALDYANQVEAQRPNNISMIYQIGSIYTDKLGASQEKEKYKELVRAQTKARPRNANAAAAAAAAAATPGTQRRELDPMLDERGMILPQLLEPRFPRPANVPPDGEWVTGARLQYLAPYQPFPYGISAPALGYNFQKQAQVLQTVGRQQHASLSATVLDSRPALALKAWSEDEWEIGRRREMRALNVAAPFERRDMEVTTANIKPDAPITDRTAMPEAVYAYDTAARVGADALLEYERHLRGYPEHLQVYQSHLDSMRAQVALHRADRDYLKAMLAPAGPDRDALLKSAAEAYRESSRHNLAVVFRYYVADEVGQAVLPAGVTRHDAAGKLNDDQLITAYVNAMELISRAQHDPDAEDRSDYQRYVERAQMRLQALR